MGLITGADGGQNMYDEPVGATDDAAVYKRVERAFSEVSQWSGLWQTLLHFVAPNLDNYHKASGTRKQVNVYDNTPMYFVNVFTSQFISNIFPPRSKFARLTASQGMIHRYMKENDLAIDSADDFQEAQDVLNLGCQKLTDQIYDLLLDSNFDVVLPQLVLNYMISCGATHVSHDNYRGHGVSFQVPLLGTFAFDTDGFGNIYGIFYSTKMSLANARLQWDLINVPENLKENAMVEFVECIVKDKIKATSGRTKNVWKYFVLLKGSNPKGVQSVTRARYFDSCHWSMMRAESIRSEVWGRGRLVEVMQDIMRINNTTKNRIISEDIASSPMFIYKDDGSINPRTVSFQPGALLKVRDTGSKNGASIAQLGVAYNGPLNEAVRQSNNAAIQRLLTGDPMLMQDKNSYQTATEYTARQHQNQMLWSKDYGKIVAFARNILLSVCDIGLSTGEIVLPEELALFEGSYDLDYFGVKLESPISKMYNAQEVDSVISMIQILSSLDQSLLTSTVNLELLPNWLSEKLGIDRRLIRTKEERDALERKAAEMSSSMSAVGSLMDLNSELVK